MKTSFGNGLAGWIRWIAGRVPRRGGSEPTRNMYKPNQVRLFIKPYCGWCRQAMDWLDDHGIRYEVLDVIGDSRAYDEMVRLTGQTFAPVIEVDGQILADFGARELAGFWSRLPGAERSP